MSSNGVNIGIGVGDLYKVTVSSSQEFKRVYMDWQDADGGVWYEYDEPQTSVVLSHIYSKTNWPGPNYRLRTRVENLEGYWSDLLIVADVGVGAALETCKLFARPLKPYVNENIRLDASMSTSGASNLVIKYWVFDDPNPPSTAYLVFHSGVDWYSTKGSDISFESYDSGTRTKVVCVNEHRLNVGEEIYIDQNPAPANYQGFHNVDEIINDYIFILDEPYIATADCFFVTTSPIYITTRPTEGTSTYQAMALSEAASYHGISNSVQVLYKDNTPQDLQDYLSRDTVLSSRSESLEVVRETYNIIDPALDAIKSVYIRNGVDNIGLSISGMCSLDSLHHDLEAIRNLIYNDTLLNVSVHDEDIGSVITLTGKITSFDVDKSDQRTAQWTVNFEVFSRDPMPVDESSIPKAWPNGRPE